MLEDGSRFELHGFQRAMLVDYFGGTTETLILVSKKNGKSTLMAALALHHLVVTPDAECVIAAASRDQAQILLNQARGFVRRSGLGKYMTVKQREIVRVGGEGRVRVMASDSDTADGVIPSLALVDELHRHRSADLYGVFRDGLGPRNGRMITISTAGDDETSPLGKMRAAAYALPGVERTGVYTYARSPDESFVMHEWALAPGDDRDDLALVKRANPAPWQDLEALRRRYESPSMTPWQWARFACGVWMQGEDTAISPLEWGKSGVHGARIPRGEPVSLGVDLGWKWDTSAIVPVWANGDRWRFGLPVIVVPPRDGTSTPVDAVFDPIAEMADRWHVERVVLDPSADGEHLAQRIEGELGLEVVSHSQKPEPMSLAAQRFTSALREGRIEHPEDPEFTSHVLAAVAKVAPGSDKWRFVKKRRPIDALIAASIVLSVVTDESFDSGPLIEVFSS